MKRKILKIWSYFTEMSFFVSDCNFFEALRLEWFCQKPDYKLDKLINQKIIRCGIICNSAYFSTNIGVIAYKPGINRYIAVTIIEKNHLAQ